jgi:hypothetical protein
MTIVTSTSTLRLAAGGLVGCRLATVGRNASTTSIGMGRRVQSIDIRMATVRRWGILASSTQKANHAGTSTLLWPAVSDQTSTSGCDEV